MDQNLAGYNLQYHCCGSLGGATHHSGHHRESTTRELVGTTSLYRLCNHRKLRKGGGIIQHFCLKEMRRGWLRQLTAIGLRLSAAGSSEFIAPQSWPRQRPVQNSGSGSDSDSVPIARLRLRLSAAGYPASSGQPFVVCGWMIEPGSKIHLEVRGTAPTTSSLRILALNCGQLRRSFGYATSPYFFLKWVL
jgi:hypothetical protein